MRDVTEMFTAVDFDGIVELQGKLFLKKSSKKLIFPSVADRVYDAITEKANLIVFEWFQQLPKEMKDQILRMK